MPQTSQQKLLQNLQNTDQQWYYEPKTIAVFSCFFVIFIISIFATATIGGLIRKATDDPETFFERYGNISVSQLETCYVVNLIIVFVSLLVIFYFLQKLIPFNSPVIYVFATNSAILAFSLVLLGFSSYNISVLRPLTEDNSDVNSANIGNILILIISVVSVLYFTYTITSVSLGKEPFAFLQKGKSQAVVK